MVYLFCIAVIQWMALAQFINAIKALPDARTPDGRARMLTAWAVILTAMLLGAPLALEVAQVAAFSNGKGVSPGRDYLPLWFMGAGSIAALATFGYRLRQQMRSKDAPFFAVGANIFGAMIGLYVAFVVMDQLMFFAPPRQDAGMLNWAIMKEDPALHDIHCEADMLIVRGIDTGTATYRCPYVVQMVFGRFSGTPIVPWPGYTEGTSAALARTIQTMQREAIKPEGKHD